MSMYGLGGPRPVVLCDPEKGAKQSFKDECDINNILRRHKAGGMVTHVNANEGVYADVTAAGDYRTAIERVRAAEKVFLGLESKTRAAFDNDVATFLDVISDPRQRDFLGELGLLPLVEAPTEPVEEPVSPAPEPS